MPAKKINGFAGSGAQSAMTTAKRPAGKQPSRQIWILVSLFSLLLSACGSQVSAASLPQTAPKSLPQNSSVRVLTSTPTPETVFVHDSVPLVYALVAPFPTVTDGVSSDELKRAWVEGVSPAPFTGQPLL